MSQEAEDDALLARLFVEELEAQLLALTPAEPGEPARRAIHKLKGSAGLVGQRALGDAFGRLERRVAGGDASAIGEAAALVVAALGALREGKPVPIARWPSPPADLRPVPIDPTLADGYRGAMVDRLARLDAALAATAPADAALAAYREIHAIKGAALAVGDEIVAWFAHGLEERLVGTHADPSLAAAALAEVARHRGALAELVADPALGLAALRVEEEVLRASIRPPASLALPLPPRRPPTGRAPADSRGPRAGDATVRVDADTLQDVFDRLSRLGQISAPLGVGIDDLRACAREAEALHRALLEARRRIGPPRPWGPPAAAVDAIEQSGDRVAELAARLGRVADRAHGARVRIAADASAAQASIGAMRTAHLADLFDRVRAAALADARRAGRAIQVEIEGAELPLDRELSEALVDPLLQLARNAVAHGIEEEAERARRGKPAIGLLRLSAEATAGAVSIVVSDDGAGVDVAEVRRRAVESGALTPELGGLLDDDRLLAFLFRPGFSTRDDADLLAGRGLGLGLVLVALQRVGGTVRLRTRRGHGLAVTLTVPSGASLIDVLWVRAGGRFVAVPAAHVLEVRAADGQALRSLAALIGRDAEGPTRAAVVIGVHPRAGAESATVGVEQLGGRDEVHLRPVDALVRATGPWAAAIAWGDEIRMSLDPHALVELASRAEPAPVRRG